jgi:hypothetical protein
MSKKTFASAPKPKLPTDDQILAFERGGTGHDTKAVAIIAPVTVAPSELTKRLSLDLPATVHTRFKTACSAAGTKMVGELLAFIEQRTKELEEQAGITRK